MYAHASRLAVLSAALLTTLAVGCGSSTNASSSASDAKADAALPAIKLTNVSYDPTRELYTEINTEFAKFWKEQKHQDVTIEQSHGGSGKQARAVIDGLDADVVTLAIAYDIDEIAKIAKLLHEDWQTKFPHHSAPYNSTITFLVRKGNPKGIKDWNDLVKEGVEVITPNPKTSGAARYSYLAAWGYALRHNGQDDAKARDFVAELYKHVPVLDSGARAATMTFTQNGIGDVLLSWENEAMLVLKDEATGKDFEIVTPSISVLAEPPVAVVDKNASAHNVLDAAKAYLNFLYSPTGQQLGAKHFYRPTQPSYVEKDGLAKFPKVELWSVEDVFGSWTEAQTKHFADGGTFDFIYQPK